MSTATPPHTPAPKTPLRSRKGLTPTSTPLSPRIGGVGDRALRDIALALEYRRLKRECVSGLVVVPESGRWRRWHGFLSLSGGLYGGGMWRLLVDIPESYPSGGLGSIPSIYFASTPPPFHPLVDARTGRLSLPPALTGSNTPSGWNPKRHRLRRLLRFAKQCLLFTPAEMQALGGDVGEAEGGEGVGGAGDAGVGEEGSVEMWKEVEVVRKEAMEMWKRARRKFVHEAQLSASSATHSLPHAPPTHLPLHTDRPTAAEALKKAILAAPSTPTAAEIQTMLLSVIHNPKEEEGGGGD